MSLGGKSGRVECSGGGFSALQPGVQRTGADDYLETVESRHRDSFHKSLQYPILVIHTHQFLPQRSDIAACETIALGGVV